MCAPAIERVSVNPKSGSHEPKKGCLINCEVRSAELTGAEETTYSATSSRLAKIVCRIGDAFRMSEADLVWMRLGTEVLGRCLQNHQDIYCIRPGLI